MRYNYFFEKTHNRKFQALAKFLKLLYLFGFVILITWFSFALRRLGYTWEDYTGFQGRTLWEVLDLLIVPITATVLAFVLGRWEKTREERITKQSQSNAALLKYYEIFSKYMIEYDMLNKDPAYTLRISLTNITKSIFSVLDHSSKRILIFFLLENQMITMNHGNSPLISLWGINLSNLNLKSECSSKVSLSRCFLSCVDFRESVYDQSVFTGSYLAYSEFKYSNLRGSNFKDCDLTHVNFEGADLSNSTLQGADLRSSNLLNVNLNGADLRFTKNLKRAINKRFSYDRETLWPDDLLPEDFGVKYCEYRVIDKSLPS